MMMVNSAPCGQYHSPRSRLFFASSFLFRFWEIPAGSRPSTGGMRHPFGLLCRPRGGPSPSERVARFHTDIQVGFVGKPCGFFGFFGPCCCLLCCLGSIVGLLGGFRTELDAMIHWVWPDTLDFHVGPCLEGKQWWRRRFSRTILHKT